MTIGNTRNLLFFILFQILLLEFLDQNGGFAFANIDSNMPKISTLTSSSSSSSSSSPSLSSLVGASTSIISTSSTNTTSDQKNPDDNFDSNNNNNNEEKSKLTQASAVSDATTGTSNLDATKAEVADELPLWRRQLPIELQQKTKTLQRIVFPGNGGGNSGIVEVYLLGTAHVSIDSSREVRQLLEAIRPNVLFLELCDQRIPMMLTPPPLPSTTIAKLPSHDDDDNDDDEPIQVDSNSHENHHEVPSGWWSRRRQRQKQKRLERQINNSNNMKNGERSMYGMAAGLLTNMQQDYAESLNVELGGEFRVAYNYWEEERQAGRPIHMILGDRPLYLTLTRAWEGLGLWGKTKLVVSLFISSFQKPNPEELREWMQKILADDSGDLLTESIAELAIHFPTLEKVIIQERDAYMACKLYQTCRHLLQIMPNPTNHNYGLHRKASSTPQVQKLVAVVGAGHIKGMCQLLTEGSNDGKTPEQILSNLVEIKKRIPEEEQRVLVEDVLEVNHELLQSMAQELNLDTAL